MYVSRPSLIGMRHPRTRYRESENPSWFGHVGVEKVGGGTCPPNKPAPPEKCSARLALQSVSRRTASPPGRSFDGAAGWDSIYHVCRAARKDSDYLVGRATRTPVAGKAAGPDSGPCATRLDPDVRKAFRGERAINDALRLVIELLKVGAQARVADLPEAVPKSQAGPRSFHRGPSARDRGKEGQKAGASS